MVQSISDLSRLLDYQVSVLFAPPSERYVIASQMSSVVQKNVYYWNLGLSHLMVWNPSFSRLDAMSVSQKGIEAYIDYLKNLNESAVVIFENLVNVLIENHWLFNLVYDLESLSEKKTWVFLETGTETKINETSLVPYFELALPSVQDVFAFYRDLGIAPSQTLVRSSLGIPKGELTRLLKRLSLFEDVETSVRSYRLNKLLDLGLEIFPEPNIKSAGGLDRLEACLDRVATLLNPIAQDFNLELPKGMLLWGLPGTGKSLSAKLGASKLSVPLLSVDWGGLVSQGAQGEFQFRYLLNLAETIAPCVLFLDDFEKAFSTWESGGSARRLAGKFLTWMQEHRSQVFTIATINRIEMLPSELIRRFDYIFFVDLPHDGARKEVFDLHLARYFSHYEFSDRDWFLLLQDYRSCTPAEIEQAIKRVAIDKYYQGMPGEVTPEDLLKERNRFVPSAERDVDQLAKIRNKKDLAQLASSPDCSKWKIEQAGLLT